MRAVVNPQTIPSASDVTDAPNHNSKPRSTTERCDDLTVLDEPRDALYLLQRWYLSQCDSEWEHSYGVSIGTLDNPGWTLRIDLAETSLGGTTRDWSKLDRSDHDWLHWRVHGDCFEAACGPTNLNEAIVAFLDIAGASRPT